MNLRATLLATVLAVVPGMAVSVGGRTLEKDSLQVSWPKLR
jgi:hypothetical protein